MTCCFGGFADISNTDSVLAEISKIQDDSLKTKKLYTLAWELKDDNPKAFKDYINNKLKINNL